VICLGGCDRSTGATWRRGVRVFVDGGSCGCGKQTVTQAARLAASQVQASIGVSGSNVTGGSLTVGRAIKTTL
jgi:hypothetical protein